QRLENFIEQNPRDPTLDLARLTLGELQLKEYFAGWEKKGTNRLRPTLTNGVQLALTNFNRVIAEFPQSPLLGKAWLLRGWCFWRDEKNVEAKASFAEAVARLPFSEDLAVARFKLADAQFKAGDFSGAMTNYDWVIQNNAKLEQVKTELLEPALYQMVRASLEQGDQSAAQKALRTILDLFPNRRTAERSLLLIGQDLTRQEMSDQARVLFSDFAKRFPDSPLAPELELAIAQTYIQEKNWPVVLEKYDQWVARFTNETLLPQVEFSRALTIARAGNETNALSLFTNFVGRFPSNSLTPLAQNWVADFYFNREQFAEAQKNYQRIYENFHPPSDLAGEARMMAGRAAYARQGFKEARDQFLALINDTNTPPPVLAQTYFALGDTIFAQFLESTNKPMEIFAEAITAFTKITTDFPNNILAPLAWGRLGDCHFQWASLKSDPKEFAAATNAYEKLLNSPLAGPASRNKAAVRLGMIFEPSQPEAALRYYAKVIYAGEESDPQWLKEAGLAAGKLCENQAQWTQAIQIYNRVLAALPALKPVLEKKILAAQTRIELQKSDR
ncbi:MAG: tetratricopeptide repeat protein, partial [Verrucomicrobiota bacterium]|nr:tetratricopeptide repeat protein [Verrucomicrobiota bacterium]